MKICTMETEFRHSLMAPFMVDSSKKDSEKETGLLSMQMVTLTKDHSTETNAQDSVSSNGEMGQSTLEICRIAKCMEKEF